MLVHWTDFARPTHTFDRLFRDFDRLFAAQERTADFAPRLDVVEEDDAWTVVALVPGLGPEDIEITVKGQELMLSGERRVVVPEGARPLRRERPSLRFSRTVGIGNDVDTDNIRATVKHGVLEVRLPKRPERQPRQITVTAE